MFLHKSYIEKSLFPEIYGKNLSANQIARLLNQVFLHNRLIKQSHFSTTLQKLKVDPNFFGWVLSKMDVGNIAFRL